MTKLNDPSARVAADLKALYLGNLRTVAFDLKLPLQGPNGSTIQWASSDERFLRSDGHVIQPEYGRGDRTVQLTATVTNGAASQNAVFTVTILEDKNHIQVQKVFPINLVAQTREPFYLPIAVAVETKTGARLPQFVDWDGPEEKQFPKSGQYTVSGHIRSSEIPVTAHIDARDHVQTTSRRPLQVHPFPLNTVRLVGDSPFKRAQDRRLAFLLTVDDDQMLYNFRQAAGLSTQGASAMAGWDAPDSNLRGHTTGHYLSALAQCYAATGNQAILRKLHYVVAELQKVQTQFATIPGIHPGFLSAYDESQFDLLEQFTPYPQIWAPYYTLHKILAGLIDAYTLAGDDTALTVAIGVGQWVHDRLSRLSVPHLQKMWGMYIAGELGGINESMAELYHLTGSLQFLTAAHYFDNDKLFFPMVQKVDALGSLHANQHIPQVVGAIKLYEYSHEERYYQIADFFWHAVTAAHLYSFGGTGDGEMFQQPNVIGAKLNDSTAETCASYNMLKLTRDLYPFAPTANKMAYYERTMVNHILATTDHEGLGGSTYFLSTKPGASKDFDVTENTCCHGTGLENHFEYGAAAYFQDAGHLYVTQFVPSRLQDPATATDVTLAADENHPETVTLTLTHLTKQLVVRKPAWSQTVQVTDAHGTPVKTAAANDFVTLPVGFPDGTVLTFTFAPVLSFVPTPDRPERVSVAYGPYILAAVSDDQEFLPLHIDQAKSLAEQFQKVPDRVALTHEGVLYRPLYAINHEHYHIYETV